MFGKSFEDKCCKILFLLTEINKNRMNYFKKFKYKIAFTYTCNIKQISNK